MSGVRVRHVLSGEHDLLRQLRLASLAADPEAFASTYAEDAGEPAERWQWWAAQSEDGTTQRTFVLVADDGRWLGLTLVRLDGVQVDVLGAMRMCHAVRPMMLEGGGAIINFSSTYGNGINPDNAINFVPVTYSTAKGAIRGLTTTLARDLAPEIRVNALAPGPISGEWETEWGVSPEHIDEAIAMNPLKRFGKPEEIAETVLFLASDGAGYITGQVIHVDGGLGSGRVERAQLPMLPSVWQPGADSPFA